MNYKPKQKLGILGGGQLGRMLIQSLINYDVDVFILDPDKDAPCKDICKKFTVGSLMDADAIIEFGRELDIITIEIEHVNVAGLYELQKMGKTIIPSPESIETIQDKGLQKLFYKKHDIPSADFIITDTINDVKNNVSFLPAFQKMRKNGYDGKGVKYLKDNTDGAFEEASLLEKAVEIEKEIAIIIVVNKDGEIKDFPLVELVFNPEYNLVDYLICPSDIVASKQEEAKQIALSVAKALNSPGIFAIEMFLTKTGEILVNETAPRTHNSGHQSIEGNYTSQFEQQARALLNLPLGNTVVREKSLMMNIIGEKEQEGDVQYQDFNEIVQLENVFVHLYVKKITKPGRKMGHITILGKTENELIEKYSIIRNKLKVIKQ
jgi:5-(carboxyamino)imidazole ribonucleotide synthase